MKYEEIFELLMRDSVGEHIIEGFNADDRDRISSSFAPTDIRPQEFDRTWENWLKRLKLWGKLNIEHVEPIMGGKKRWRLSEKDFIDALTNDDLMKMFGDFTIVRTDINKLEIYRDFLWNGKKMREIFYVWIDLDDEMKKAFR